MILVSLAFPPFSLAMFALFTYTVQNLFLAYQPALLPYPFQLMALISTLQRVSVLIGIVKPLPQLLMIYSFHSLKTELLFET